MRWVLAVAVLVALAVVGAAALGGPLMRGGAGEGAAVQGRVPEHGTALRYVAIGDSYTIGHLVAAEERWPNRLSAALTARGIPVELVANPAATGWTTADALEREVPVLAGAEADFVTVQVGVNDWVQGVSPALFQERFSKLLDAVRKELRDPQNVLVVTVPDFSATPAGGQYSGERDVTRGIAEFNGIIEEEAHARGLEAADVFGVSQVSRNRLDFIASDGLHPSALQYEAWVEAILPAAERVLTD